MTSALSALSIASRATSSPTVRMSEPWTNTKIVCESESGTRHDATPTQVTARLMTLTRVVSSRRLGSYQGRVMAADQDLYLISMAAERLGMHPQTLRKYERLGLIQPSRTIGSMRLYSRQEIERLRVIKHLVDELGINLAGVQRLLSIAEVMQRIQPLMDEGALSTGAGRRQLLSEMRRLNEMVGL